MRVYSVIDTNVLVSAMLSKHLDSATSLLLEHLFAGNVRHFPSVARVVTPNEMLDIIDAALKK